MIETAIFGLCGAWAVKIAFEIWDDYQESKEDY